MVVGRPLRVFGGSPILLPCSTPDVAAVGGRPLVVVAHKHANHTWLDGDRQKTGAPGRQTGGGRNMARARRGAPLLSRALTRRPLPNSQVRTNAPDRVSVDVAAGVVEPRCTRAVRVFWSDGDKAHAPAAATGDVVVVSSRRLPAGTPLPEAAAAALLGRGVGEAAPDAVLPVVALPRCGDADGAAARLRAAATAAGSPAASASLIRALVDVLYCEGVVNAEGAVLAAGAAALALADGGGKAPAAAACSARPVTPDGPPAPITPGASPDGVRVTPSPLEAAGAATADDVADEVSFVLFWGGE